MGLVGRGCSGAFGGCCVLCGLPLFLLGLFLLWQAWQSNGWATVDGIILESEMSVGNIRGDGTGDTTYGADLSYEYQVDGELYRGTRMTVFDVRTGDEQRAQAFLERYPEGQEVEVFYDPDKPQSSVLEPGVSGWTYSLAGLGLLFLGFGVFLIYRAILW